MRILHEEYVHPTQASVVALSVFESRDSGYLVTEERRGTAVVYRTLGVFDTREAATARVRERARELEGQRYRRADAAA
jgi:hypothetical protein